jgi:transcriptional regulator with XRE-family HTH domain
MNERERIELLMKCYDLTPSQFADKTGIQRASVSHIISGRNKPSLEVMLKVYDAFPEVDMKWLMMGVGEVPVRKSVQVVEKTASETLFAESNSQQSRDEAPLFNSVEMERPIVEEAKPRRVVAQKLSERNVADSRAKRSLGGRMAQMAALQPDKRIKEVRIYYSDGTYETLIPENR